MRLNSNTIQLATLTTIMQLLVTWTIHEPEATQCETLVAATWLETIHTLRISVSQLTETTTDTSPSQQASSPLPTLQKSSLDRPMDSQQVTTVPTATTGTNTKRDVTQTLTCHLASRLTTSRSPLTETTATIDSALAATVTST